MINRTEEDIITKWEGDVNKPLVSICCVTFNHEQFISEALDSFLMQETNFPFEICLGEDNSSDKTREICSQYAERYPNIIKLFLRKRDDVIYINNLPTGRFNFIETIKECNGEYIALCEGDDFFTNVNKLQIQVTEMQKHPKVKMEQLPIDMLDINPHQLIVLATKFQKYIRESWQ